MLVGVAWRSGVIFIKDDDDDDSVDGLTLIG